MTSPRLRSAGRRGPRQGVHAASARRRAAAGRRQRRLHRHARRMRRARRPLGRRQVLDPEDRVRQLSRRARAHIWLADGERFLDIASATPREIVDARRRIMGYVSQFLRVIPRVSALDIVAAAARDAGLDARRPHKTARLRCWRGSTCPSGCGRCRPRPSPAASSSASISRAASRASTVC